MNNILIVGHINNNPERSSKIIKFLNSIFDNLKDSRVYIYTTRMTGTSFLVMQECKKRAIPYSKKSFLEIEDSLEKVLEETQISQCICLGNSAAHKDFLNLLKDNNIEIKKYAIS